MFIRYLVSALFLVGISGTSFADVGGRSQTGTPQDTSTKKIKLARQVVDLARTDAVLARIRQLFDAEQEFSQHVQNMDSEKKRKVQAAWQQAVAVSYRPEIVKDVLVSDYAAAFTEPELLKLIDWYQSPFGRKISALETKMGESNEPANSLETEMARLQTMWESLKRDPDRKAMLERLVALTGGAESQALFMYSVSMSVTVGVQEGLPSSQPRMDATISLQQKAQMIDLMRQAFEPMMVPSYAVLYERLTNVDLARYLKYRTTSLSEKEVFVGMRAYNFGLSNISKKIGLAFAKALAAQDI